MKAIGAFGAVPAAVLSCALIVGAVGIYSVHRIQVVDDANVQDLQRIQRADTLLEKAIGLLKDCETGERGYVLTGREEFLEPYHNSKLLFEQTADRLQTLLIDPEQSAEFARFRSGARSKFDWTAEVLRVRREKGLAAATAMVAGGEGKRRMDVQRKSAAAISRRGEALTVELEKQRLASNARADGFGLSGWLLTAILTAAAAFLSIKELVARDKAEQESLARERMLAGILSALGDGVIVADASGKFTLWNAAAEKIMGLGAKDVGPGRWTKTYGVFLPDGKTPFPTEELPLVKALAGEAVDNAELFVRNEGAPEGRLVGVSGRPLDSGGGVVVLRDITRERSRQAETAALNQELQRRTQELLSANKELEAFSYSVSHDLRAPLRALDGFSAALSEDFGAGLEPQAKDYLDRIRKAAQRMGQLIDDLLAISKVSRTQMQIETVDLGALSEAVVKELAVRDPSRSVVFDNKGSASGQGDARLLRVVLENLLGNAWKYTAKTAAARVEFGSVVSAEGERSYFVRDNGAGFDMAHAGKLFGAFQRLHTTEEFAGSGIGLATAARIVHRHGGKIWADAAVGQGATFYFTLGPGSPQKGG